jgi:hypothetical protein
MQVVYARCARLDVHKKTVNAWLNMCEAGASKQQQTRTFRTFTGALLELTLPIRESARKLREPYNPNPMRPTATTKAVSPRG